MRRTPTKTWRPYYRVGHECAPAPRDPTIRKRSGTNVFGGQLASHRNSYNHENSTSVREKKPHCPFRVAAFAGRAFYSPIQPPVSHTKGSAPRSPRYEFQPATHPNSLPPP